MVNIGKVGIGNAPYFEDEASLKQWLRKQNAYKAEEMQLIRSIINQAGTGSEVELAEKGGLTLTTKSHPAESIFIAMDTNDNDYDGYTITGHYYTTAGVAASFTKSINITNSTTEVAGPTDFACWNLDDYTIATVLVLSGAVKAGHNCYVGLTGMVANAELRYATIAATATYPVHTTLFSKLVLYGAEETNTAGDVGKVITIIYTNIAGLIKTATITLAADTTTIVRAVSSALVVQDFMQLRTAKTTAVLGKYVVLGMDADKLVGIAAIDTNYGVIEEGYSESIHTAYYVPKGRSSWLSEICVNNSVATPIDTYLKLTYTPYGDTIAKTCIISLPNNGIATIRPMLHLAAMSALKFELKGNLSDNTFDIHIIEAVAA